MKRRDLLTAGLGCASLAGAPAQAELPRARPVPLLQATPLPYQQVALERGGAELARYHYGPDLRRPFIYPVNGPSGRSLTRMGHPHSPVGHSHHNSFWVSHFNLNGDDFWGDTSGARIVPQWIARLTDGDDEAGVYAVNHWVGKSGALHLAERRGVRVRSLPEEEWLAIVSLELEAPSRPAVFDKTPFGLVAVRMAKSIGVADGGGAIRNSEGARDESGPNGVFWKPARWVDYSGPIAPDVVEGLTLMDHPSNGAQPPHWHVRNDGWMGCSFSFSAPRTIEPGQKVRLDYALYVHRGFPSPAEVEKRWSEFAALPRLPELPNERK